MNEDIGQQWSPPQELMLPTPRPVRRVSWVAAAGLSGYKPALVGSYLILALILAASVLSLVFLDDKTLGFGGPAVVVGILILSSAVYSANCRKAKRLLIWGKPARAVVIDAELRWLRGGGCAWIWTIEYQDETGNLVQSEIKEHKMSTRAREPAKYVRNQVLTVLYAPHKPTKAIAYPVAGYEIAEPGSS
jgi:hypothetical protein